MVLQSRYGTVGSLHHIYSFKHTLRSPNVIFQDTEIYIFISETREMFSNVSAYVLF